jgi:type II secretory pathway component PulF
LKVGESIGNLTKVLPACRRVMERAASKSQTAVNSSVIILLVWPVAPIILWVLSIFVLPKLMSIAADFETPMPPWIGTLSSMSFAMTFVIVGLWLLILLLGMRIPGRTGFIPTGVRPWADGLDLRIPWRRHRLERDFSSMLAILLDAEVPEANAVQMAAESTGNAVFIARSKSVLADLQNGVELCKALKRMDASGEFEWRLRNASFPPEGFQSALAGWHESLEAKAFQQEQTFSQAVTTSFILLNGLMVGMSAMSIFAFIIAITEDVALW